MPRKGKSLTTAERAGIAAAARHNLFVLFEGPRASRTWRLYCKASGRCVGYWRPHTGEYELRGERGRATTAEEVVGRAGSADAPRGVPD